ncbi:MAG TPA: hypothetical protein VFG68_16215 [Fimbriiglobus sp.]|nr:hypothetical protein [Fimbriiglobus sp.]
MRRTWIIGVMLAVGCQGLERPNELWMTQINAANSLPDPNARGSTLARIAESAAYGGDAVATRYALSQLGDGPQRDELAAECAVHLAVQDREAARSLVREIGDPGKRDATLARLDGKAKDNASKSDTSQADPVRPAGVR